MGDKPRDCGDADLVVLLPKKSTDVLPSFSLGIQLAIRSVTKEGVVTFSVLKSSKREKHFNKTIVGLVKQILEKLNGVKFLLEVLQFSQTFLVIGIVHYTSVVGVD
jgi:hypothetical protein